MARQSGGESGIRTHGTVSRTHAFQACALSHSAISPGAPSLEGMGRILQGREGLAAEISFKFLEQLGFLAGPAVRIGGAGSAP
jgi:hypothetical protein